jgi:ankyrin repeat protein
MSRLKLVLAGLLCWASLAGAGESIEPDGTTALHRAIYAGDVSGTRRLIAAGADPHAANLFGATGGLV